MPSHFLKDTNIISQIKKDDIRKKKKTEKISVDFLALLCYNHTAKNGWSSDMPVMNGSGS